ncbi:hypothetical protein HK102_006764 [Quaeritorhiza haematococci]|nr:hypothetical protein HK102_006764 [Quaeritorhiza haematococci]
MWVILPHRLQKAANDVDGIKYHQLRIQSLDGGDGGVGGGGEVGQEEPNVKVEVLADRYVKDDSPVAVVMHGAPFRFVHLTSEKSEKFTVVEEDGESEDDPESQTWKNGRAGWMSRIWSALGLALPDWVEEDVSGGVKVVSLGKVHIPDVMTPPHSTKVPFNFNGTIKDLNVGYVSNMIQTLLQGKTPASNQMMFRMESRPIFEVLGVGRWRIPMWSTSTISLDTSNGTTTNNGSLLESLNVTVVDKGVSMIPGKSPTDPWKYTFFALLSFTNPSVLTLAPQHFGFVATVYYKGTAVCRVRIPSSTVKLDMGRNEEVRVEGESMGTVEGNTKLMEMVGEYAEGNDVRVKLRDFGVEYESGRRRVGWVEEMVRGWDFEVELPPQPLEDGEDEDGGWGFRKGWKGWKKVLRELMNVRLGV